MDGGDFKKTFMPTEGDYFRVVLIMGMLLVLIILLISLFSISAKAPSVSASAERMLTAKEAAQRGLQQEHMLTAKEAAQRGLQQEHYASRSNAESAARRMLGNSFERYTPASEAARKLLQGGISSESYISDLPMLGGAPLTDGAIALRAADPISSEGLSPSQTQYMKENELLEHLLYK